MDENNLISSISEYETQLTQIELAISATSDAEERNSLIDLRNDINQLLSLTKENLSVLQDKQEASSSKTNEPSNDTVTDEYAVFMAEMKQIGAVDNGESSDDNSKEKPNIKEELSSLEGMKCQAPHDHHFGGTVYHNALVCSVIASDEEQSFEDIKVRIMFTNPTHQEMLPCPYFLESECKFSIEQCRFSHGEIVSLSSLKEYKEPDFASIKVGSQVLAKQISNKLWHRAKVTSVGNNTCEVQFESNKHKVDVSLADVMPLENTEEDRSDTESSGYSENEEEVDANLIEQSLINQPASQAIGDWEKHTKGIGSKLLQQMGYVVGTGLGKNSDGRIEPVEAVILPTGKSLDHCMKLKEKAGGDENLFKVEKRLKKLKHKQEERNKKAYNKAKQKTDIFEFLNDTFGSKPVLKTNDPTKPGFSKNTHRKDLGKESNRDLNVCGLKVEEDIRRVERDIWKINETLTRHSDERTVMNKNLKAQLQTKQSELSNLKLCETNITNEQTLRKDKKKLTIF